MKRYHSFTGPTSSTQYPQYQSNGGSNLQFAGDRGRSQDRWSSQERLSEGDSQGLTQYSQQSQQSSQRTQPVNVSQTNQFENILAAQRHAELMSYLKQFSKAVSDASINETEAIKECQEQLQSVSKNLLELTADLQRLKDTGKEQLSRLEIKVITVHKELCSMANNLAIQSEHATNTKNSGNADGRSPEETFPSDCDSFHFPQETEDGICVTDYLFEVQQRRLRSRSVHILGDFSGPIPTPSHGHNLRKSPQFTRNQNDFQSNHFSGGVGEGEGDTALFEELFLPESPKKTVAPHRSNKRQRPHILEKEKVQHHKGN
jgi:uncharacterized protein YaaR (DUF327 family)